MLIKHQLYGSSGITLLLTFVVIAISIAGFARLQSRLTEVAVMAQQSTADAKRSAAESS